MAVVYPAASRVKIEEHPDSLTLTIPVRRNWFILLFIGIWLGFWVLGELTVLGVLTGIGMGWFGSGAGPGSVFPGGTFFLAFWLAGWTLGGFFAAAILLYQVRGREIVIRNGQYLRHVRDFLVYRHSREYLNEHVKDLRISRANPGIYDLMSPARGLEIWGIGGGTLCFDYGSRTIRFGAGLEEAEAKPLVALLRGRSG